jgi:hypothetical protein
MASGMAPPALLLLPGVPYSEVFLDAGAIHLTTPAEAVSSVTINMAQFLRCPVAKVKTTWYFPRTPKRIHLAV